MKVFHGLNPVSTRRCFRIEYGVWGFGFVTLGL